VFDHLPASMRKQAWCGVLADADAERDLEAPVLERAA
jgi:hypothetical protein